MIGLEDVTAAFGRVQLAQDDGLEFFFVLVRPFDDIHVAAKGDLVAVLAAQVHDIQARFGFQRVVGVHAQFDEIPKDAFDVAAAVVDDRQAGIVAGIDHGFEARFVVFAPIVGREKDVFAIGHVAPDDHAIDQSIGGFDLGFDQLQRPLVGALDETAHLLWIHGDPQQEIFRADDADHVLVGFALAAIDREIGAQ